MTGGVQETLATFLGTPPVSVLEVACGTARLFRSASEARSATASAERLVRSSPESLPFVDATFDRVFCVDVLHLVSDRARFFAEARRILKPGGICVLAGIGGSGMHKETFSNLAGELTASLRSKFGSEKFVLFGVDINKKDLGVLRELTESGKIAPALTKTYPLTETTAAYKYLETGHASGKIAITVE